jgi:hypothetical protein
MYYQTVQKTGQLEFQHLNSIELHAILDSIVWDLIKNIKGSNHHFDM